MVNIVIIIMEIITLVGIALDYFIVDLKNLKNSYSTTHT